MGIEHLLASLCASWIISSRKKKEQRHREEAIYERRMSTLSREDKIKQYLEKVGCNKKRQNELARMARSTLLEDKEKFHRILGRPCCDNETSLTKALRAIADKEGWTYYDESDLMYDLEYCKIADLYPPSSEHIENHHIHITEMRRKEKIWQEWAAKHPKCIEARVSPEYYESEEQFALVVEHEYYKWRDKSFNHYNINPHSYETKAEYDAAISNRIKELDDYKEEMEALNINNDIAVSYFCRRIDDINKMIEEKSDLIPLEIYLHLLYLNFCISKTYSLYDMEYFYALRGLARQNGLDLDVILEKVEKGTLVPKGTKYLQNYYLGVYILTKEHVVYAVHSSRYYHLKFGFTLEEFAEHCGPNPNYHFSPPQKGPRSMPR